MYHSFMPFLIFFYLPQVENTVKSTEKTICKAKINSIGEVNEKGQNTSITHRDASSFLNGCCA
jgi:hypothetical protein